jgi:serine/threonine protein kinase
MRVAIKIIDKTAITEDYVLTNLHREGALLKKLQHPHVASLYQLIETG